MARASERRRLLAPKPRIPLPARLSQRRRSEVAMSFMVGVAGCELFVEERGGGLPGGRP
jgi:hypothetical protein